MKKFITINLNQSETKEARIEVWRNRIRWGAFGIIITLLLGSNISVLLIGNGYRDLISRKTGEIAQIKDDINKLRKKGKNLSKSDIIALADLEGNRYLWARYLEMLGEMTPEDMALTGLKYRNRKMIIEGIGVIYQDEDQKFEIVYNFINTLKQNREFSDNFSRIKFDQGSRKEVRGQDIYEFRIEASLKPGGRKTESS